MEVFKQRNTVGCGLFFGGFFYLAMDVNKSHSDSLQSFITDLKQNRPTDFICMVKLDRLHVVSRFVLRSLVKTPTSLQQTTTFSPPPIQTQARDAK